MRKPKDFIRLCKEIVMESFIAIYYQHSVQRDIVCRCIVCSQYLHTSIKWTQMVSCTNLGIIMIDNYDGQIRVSPLEQMRRWWCWWQGQVCNVEMMCECWSVAGSLSPPDGSQPQSGSPHLQEGQGCERWRKDWQKGSGGLPRHPPGGEWWAGPILSDLSLCGSNSGEENFANLLSDQTTAGGGGSGCSEDPGEDSHRFQWWWQWQWLNPVWSEPLNPPLQSHVTLTLSPGLTNRPLQCRCWLDACEQSCQATGLSKNFHFPVCHLLFIYFVSHLKWLSISSRVLCLVSGTNMMQKRRPRADTAVYTQNTP